MSHHRNTSSEFLHAYHQYEGANSFNLGAFVSDMFNKYGVEAAIVIGSVLAGIYLVMSGLAILGLGLPVVVFLFVYLYASYRDTQSGRGWPPIPEDCPNGFYKDPTNQDSTQTTCLPVPGYSGETRFQYPAGDFATGCNTARGQGYDWDRCGF